MKVCLFTHTFPRFCKDTAAPFMDGVAQGISDAGNEVFVLTPYSPFFKNTKRDYHVRTYRYIFPNILHKLGYSETLSDDKKLKTLSLLLSPFLIIFGVIALYQLVKKEKIDLINAHWILPNGFMAAVISRLTGVPVVSTLPGSDVYMAGKNVLYKLMAKFAATTSKVVTSNSGQLLTDLANITGVNLSGKTKVIIYGVNPEIFKPDAKNNSYLRKKLSVVGHVPIILGVGRLVAKKGFRYLIEAIPNVLEKHPNAVFVIVGGGDQRNILEGMVDKLGISKSIRFTGLINYRGLKDYYNLADIFVLPSIRDEMGNLDDQSVSVVEAMACGKPIVTTNFPGYRVVVKGKANGYLVKEKRSDQIAQALTKILDSEKLRIGMGKISRQLVLDNFSWKAVGEEYSTLFSEIASPKKYYSNEITKILDSEDRLRIAHQIAGVIQDYRGDTKSLTCLDVACSSGVITSYMADKFWEVIGVDVDRSALEIANKNFQKSNLKFDYMNAENLAFKENTFDLVVCNQVYNFVDHPQKLIKEIYRVLKPGGICFFSARNKLALMEPQYHLPFLSWLPYNFGKAYIRLFKRGDDYFGEKYLSLWDLRQLVSDFKITDYTVRVIKDPGRYKFTKLEKYNSLAKILPLDWVLPYIPNYIWVLKKG